MNKFERTPGRHLHLEESRIQRHAYDVTTSLNALMRAAIPMNRPTPSPLPGGELANYALNVAPLPGGVGVGSWCRCRILRLFSGVMCALVRRSPARAFLRPPRTGVSALLLFASVLLFGAVGTLSEEIPFRTLAQGNQSGIGVATNLVIKTRSEWEKHWKAHQGKAEPVVRAPAVDFGKEMVVAVTMGQKPTGGYAIKIQRAESTASSLKIFIEQRTPGPGALVTQAFTSPFHFVAVAKSELKPEFKLGG